MDFVLSLCQNLVETVQLWIDWRLNILRVTHYMYSSVS